MPRDHGTRARYVIEKCRCEPCTAANRSYARERYRAHSPALIPAHPTRRRLVNLSKAGIGRRTVAAATGISQSTLSKIRNGTTTHVTHRTQHLIATLNNTTVAVPNGRLVDAAETLRKIDWLTGERGWTRGRVARSLGAVTPSLQIAGNGRVLASTAAKVEELYNEELAVASRGSGVLLCHVCRRPLTDHRLTEACWRVEAYA